MGETAFVVDRFGDTMGGQLSVFHRRIDDLIAAFLVSYENPKTRESYLTSLRQYVAFCERMGFDPLVPERPHVELFMRQLEMDGRAARTRKLRLTALRRFYEYLLEEDVVEKNPTTKVKPPKITRLSPTGFLRSGQMYDLVNASQMLGPHAHGLICLLVFNGLRIAEACNANCGSLHYREGYSYLRVTRKGGAIQDVELARRTEQAIRVAQGERRAGEPLFLTRYRTRMTQQAAKRILENCRPAIRNCPARLHCHLIRHSWASECARLGLPTDQIVHDGGWVDARMLHAIYTHGHDMPGRATSHRIESSVLSG